MAHNQGIFFYFGFLVANTTTCKSVLIHFHKTLWSVTSYLLSKIQQTMDSRQYDISMLSFV